MNHRTLSLNNSLGRENVYNLIKENAEVEVFGTDLTDESLDRGAGLSFLKAS